MRAYGYCYRRPWCECCRQPQNKKPERAVARRAVVAAIEETCDDCGRTYTTCCCDELDDIG